MTAAVASLSAAGSIPIKLPSVAVNTTDRAAITAGLEKNLGNKIIPIPDYSGETSASIKSSFDTQMEVMRVKREKFESLIAEQKVMIEQYKVARKKLTELVNNYPQGDPQIAAAVAECNEIMKKINDKTDEMDPYIG